MYNYENTIFQKQTGGGLRNFKHSHWPLFQKLAEVLNLVEETGTWPGPLTRDPHLKSCDRLVPDTLARKMG